MQLEPLFIVPTDKSHALCGVIGEITGFMYAMPNGANCFHHCYQVTVDQGNYYVSAVDVPRYFRVLTQIERDLEMIDFTV